jgi:GntR family transcriptional regulator, transcriptional repressor for pyruvate dehydrogenase complex
MAATDQAIDGIRELIGNGSVRPGDRRPKENELAGLLGVSRSSLREAVRALEVVGVVQAR